MRCPKRTAVTVSAAKSWQLHKTAMRMRRHVRMRPRRAMELWRNRLTRELLDASGFGDSHQDDLRMEECAGDALRDADDFALSVEDFYEGCGGHFGEIDGTTVADPCDILSGGG